MHLASQVCSWGSVDRAGFWSAVQQWGAWAASSGTGIQFFTGLPIWGWGFESWVNGMVSKGTNMAFLAGERRWD